MPNMSKNVHSLKKKLQEENALLEKELGEIAARDPKNPSDWNAREEERTERADPNMVADVEEDLRERHAISDELEKRLVDVKSALLKIDKETYGICEVCKKRIEEDRLEANPAARTCKKHLNENL